jgi:type IV pilus assembly protein PilV
VLKWLGWIVVNKGQNMNKQSSGGFSMVEVLVSLVVFSLGFLALSLLQNKALNNNQSAYITSQATILAQSMMDRIRANPSGDYILKANTTLSAPANLCRSSASDCSPTDIAAVDKFVWQQSLDQRLAGATGVITQDKLNTTPGTDTFDQLKLYRVTVNWTERGGSQWGVDTKDAAKSITLESL